MKVKPLSRAELLALPPVTTLPELGRAFGISEPVARERHRLGEWAELGIRVNRLGLQYRVVTADIWRVLGVDPADSSPAIAAVNGRDALADEWPAPGRHGGWPQNKREIPMSSVQPDSDIAMIRRRRAASQRLPPLDDGIRDPVDGLAGHPVVPVQRPPYDVTDLGLDCPHGANCPGLAAADPGRA